MSKVIDFRSDSALPKFLYINNFAMSDCRRTQNKDNAQPSDNSSHFSIAFSLQKLVNRPTSSSRAQAA
jgi:hypothetical protein